MRKSDIKSKVIGELRRGIKCGETKAVDSFWDRIKKEGSPIVENIDGDAANLLVTFIYRAEEKIENVVLINYATMFDLKEHLLMNLEGTDLWYGSYVVPNDIRFRYYFSVNDDFGQDWMKRYSQGKHDVFNQLYTIFDTDNGEEKKSSYHIMNNSKEHLWVKERAHISKGDIEEHFFCSEGFKKDRRIRVYKPSGYKQGEGAYKYLVLTDGDEYIEVLSAINVLDNLIADKKIPPVVAILVDSTEDRAEELRCSDKFLNILTEEIIPWAREKYNISQKPEDAIIAGLSLGGLTAAYMGLKKSNMFGNILSQSGSFWYKPDGVEEVEDNCWMATQFDELEKLPLKFFMNVGELENKVSMIGTNTNLKDKLVEKGYEVYFGKFKSGHDYLSWGETLADGLISLIGNK